MSRADQLLAQYQTKIAKVGQWVAVRRYVPGTPRTYTDTLTRAYVVYKANKEFVGAVTQSEIVAIALAGPLSSIMDVRTDDQLVVGFYGYDQADTPPLNEESHTSSGKVKAIQSAIKRAPGGTVIALEIHAVG